MVGTCFDASSTHRNLKTNKNQNLNIWWYFKVSQTNCV
jgi:hypothetical protein